MVRGNVEGVGEVAAYGVSTNNVLILVLVGEVLSSNGVVDSTGGVGAGIVVV